LRRFLPKARSRELIGLIEEAQSWERILRSGDAADSAAFAAWIKRSPLHLQAYLQHIALETEITGLDSAREVNLETLLSQCLSNVYQLDTGIPQSPSDWEARSRPQSSLKRSLVYASIASIVGLCSTLLWFRAFHISEWIDYATITGEQRRIP